MIFMIKLPIENPRVPGSIPGRGTILRSPCRNARAFLIWRILAAVPRYNPGLSYHYSIVSTFATKLSPYT